MSFATLGPPVVDVDLSVDVRVIVIVISSVGRNLMRQLSHERLDVYQKAIEFLAIAVQLASQIPKGYAAVADQLKRAAVSSVLSIAEAAGKPTPGENKKHCGIARGSALECGAALDTLRVLGAGETLLVDRGKELLVDVVAMLTKLCR